MTYHPHIRRSGAGHDDSRRAIAPFSRRLSGTFDSRPPLPAIPQLPSVVVAQRQITDNIDAILQTLPPRVVDPLRNIEDRDNLLEVVLDFGRAPEARFPGREVVLSQQEVSGDDLDFVVARI